MANETPVTTTSTTVPDQGTAFVPPEPLDERGVPYKNRVAEYERKLSEAAERQEKYENLLGQMAAQQRQAAPPSPAPQTLFDDETQRFVDERSRKIAQEVAYAMLSRAQLVQEANDPEIQKEAKAEFQAISQNPAYATWTQDQREVLAVKNAKIAVLGKRLEAGKQQGTQQALQDAAAAQAAGATLPGTSLADKSKGQDKETYIKAFVADPDERNRVRKMYKLDPDSQQGQEKLRRVAEFAWRGSPVSEKFSQTIEMVRSGGAQ